MAKRITKRINSQFNPTLFSGYPVYATGGAIDPYSMMFQQGQQLLSDVGTSMDNYFTSQRPDKANLGSAFFSNYLSGGMGIPGAIKGVGAMLNRKNEFEAQQDFTRQQQQEGIKKELISNLPAQHYYTPTFAMGGKFTPGTNILQPRDSEGNRRYLLREWKQNRNNSPIEFGGGKFGGGGAGNTFGNNYQIPVEWTDTRIPIEGDSFNDAFRKARKAGKKEFTFNGKKFNTDLGPDSTYNPSKGKVKEQLRLRMLYDENNKIIQDSTRFEPELGQPIVNTIDKGMKNTGSFKYGGGLKGSPHGKATAKDIEIFKKKYPQEMAMGTQVEYEHTQNKNLAERIAADHIKDFEKMHGGSGYYQGLKDFGLTDELAYGGILNSYAGGGNLDNTTVYANGGQHESNPMGGVPLGNNALVEEGEVRFKDYVFSNRIPYTKKK